jgi:hypothetical protein
MAVHKRIVSIIATLLVLSLAATFFLAAASPALAQDEGEGPEGGEVPPELQAKMEEFKEAATGLREYGALLKADAREFRTGMKELLQKARSLPRDEKWDLIDEISAARDEYLGTVESELRAVKETAGAMKDALSSARGAWEGEDIDGALSGLDGAIAKAGELKVQLDELHQLFREVLEVVDQLGAEAGGTSAPAGSWTA